MIKVILFDCDGPIIKRDKYFSQRLGEDRGIIIDHKNESSFFQTDFLQCEIGKADLKQVLPKWLPVWNWEGSVDELLDFWFSGEAETDKEMLNYISELKQKGIKCFLSTNQEKYRTEYLWNVVGLKNVLDGVFSSCYLGYMKPDQGFWQEAYKSFSNIPKEQVLVLDDKQSNIDSAISFGFKAEFYQDFKSFKQVMLNKYQME